MRILITGSRDWDDQETIEDELDKITNGFRARNVTLVSGGCPTGADAMCERFAEELGWNVEVHKADWAGLGKRAGVIRNKEMADLGADYCLAFIKNKSIGATHCATAATLVGIKTLVISAEGP